MRPTSRLVRRFALASLISVSIAFAAASSWQKQDPAQWTSEDIYQILNNSPWSKSVNVLVSRTYGQSDGNGGVWGEGGPGGGMGRMPGGWGGGGMGRGRSGRPSSTEGGPAVTVQWASALPVRLAEAKSTGGALDPATLKALNEYVIAVVGFPKSGFQPRDSTPSNDNPDDTRLADHLKVITVLSFGQERLNPTKVELNQGRDGRAIFHFEKSESISSHEKDAEFRITGDQMELRKKFPLKDMEYQGKLEL